jgi:hypothetical protein
MPNLATAIGIAVALVSSRNSAQARDFPGAVVNGGIGFRTSQSATLEGEAGYLWRVPLRSYVGGGPVITADAGLGGGSLGCGAMLMFECVHAFGCQAVSLEGEVYRPWLLSDWDKQVALGGRLTYTLYLLRLNLAMYGPGRQNDGYRYAVGVGLQLPY